MAVNLTPGAISKLSTSTSRFVDLKPVLQVTDLWSLPTPTFANGARVEKNDRYKIVLSDGSFHQTGIITAEPGLLVGSQRLQIGSIVQLTQFVCSMTGTRMVIVIIDLNVICSKCDILGDPKPFPPNETPLMQRSIFHPEEGHADPDLYNDVVDSHHPQEPLTSTQICSQKSDHKMLTGANDISILTRMMIEKYKEDDMGACFEKLEKIGWGTEDPLYDTAIMLFGESADYRKVWMHLKPESCEKWVKNAGSKFGLLG